MTQHVSNEHQRITIDLITGVLSRSIFHPFVAWTLPLCARAVSAPYSSFQFIATCVYAVCISLIWILSVVNHRVAYGIPREIDWDEEVVVITGGASGLGKILAEMYGMRGASVAVLDVRRPEGLARMNFYECDVGDPNAVDRVKSRIEKDVRLTSCSPLSWFEYAIHALSS